MSQLFVPLVNVVIAMTIASIVSLEDANRRSEQSGKPVAINTGNVLPRDPRNLFKSSPSVFLLHLLKHKYPQYQKLDTIPTTTPPPRRDCICVPFYQCDANQTVITDGSGIIDFR